LEGDRTPTGRPLVRVVGVTTHEALRLLGLTFRLRRLKHLLETPPLSRSTPEETAT
jgi:hypothetical protein